MVAVQTDLSLLGENLTKHVTTAQVMDEAQS
jgi:hypothetical protein